MVTTHWFTYPFLPRDVLGATDGGNVFPLWWEVRVDRNFDNS